MLELNKIYNMDCIEGMKQIPDNSIDSIVTDPPYELGFMGKSWDNSGIANSVEMWKEAYRILKPGGYLLSFGGTRTYHRMASAIEDAGFEIRDMINWTYGSGFPKSLNIGKAIDKLQGNERETVLTNPYADGYIRKSTGNISDANDNVKFLSEYKLENGLRKDTKGTSEFEGWGTALKPAHEPIVVARKPLSEKTVAENVLKYGTGGINIDESRVVITEGDEPRAGNRTANFGTQAVISGGNGSGGFEYNNQGRFPANFIHDGSPEVLQEFEKAGVSSPGHWANTKVTGFGAFGNGKSEYFGVGRKCEAGTPARFFKSCEFGIEDSPSFIYTAKASKSERNEGCEELENKEQSGSYQFRIDSSLDGNKTAPRPNNHPTVKPLKLMEYLVKLVTPKGGICLDPFIGSGTTAIACKKNGFKYLGFEKEAEYMEIITARLDAVTQTRLESEDK